MDKRTQIPVTLPRAGPTAPFWQDPPDPAVADLRSAAELPDNVDVVIVGSGITGASIAWHLLGLDGGDGGGGDVASSAAPAPSVLMLEARQACSGATGRNGGHTKAASYRSFLDHAAAHGTAAAVQIARLELAGIRAVHGLAAGEGGIACDAHPCDTLDVVYDPAQWARAQEAVAAMRAALPAGDPAAEYTLYSRAEALAAGFPYPCSDDETNRAPICGVVRYPAGSVSAYRFTVGVLKACLAQGLNLHTNTPVLSLSRREEGESADDDGDGGYRWTVRTDRGAVAARHVVLATNAYTAFLVPALQGVVVPLRGQIAMHRAGASLPGAAADKEKPSGSGGSLETTYSFIYDQGYEYMITRPPGSASAGDVIIGGGLKFARGDDQEEEEAVKGAAPGLCEYGTTDDTALNPAVSAYLRDAPVRYFGRDRHWGADHPDGRVRREWTGIMGYTPDGHPLVGEMPSATDGGEDNAGLWLCCAFQGHGMVYAWPCGRAAAAMVQGRDDAALQQWFPDCFRASAARLQARFAGRLHTSAKAKEQAAADAEK